MILSSSTQNILVQFMFSLCKLSKFENVGEPIFVSKT